MKASASQLAVVLDELTRNKSKSEAKKVIGNFANFIFKKDKAGLLPEILEKYEEKWNQDRGIVRSEIKTSRKLSSEEEKEIASFIKKKYQAKEVELEEKINPSLIGGIVIQVGDEILDASVRFQVERLKKLAQRK